MASKQKISKYASVVILVLAGVSLFLAQSAYWVNHTVFNQQNFSQITTASLLSESSRDAIASSIVGKTLENNPIAERVIGGRAEALISGLLGSDLSNRAIEGLTSKTYAYVTSSDRQDIKIDLTAITTPLSGIVTLTQNDGRLSEVQQRVPDEIVLIHSDAFPDFSGTVRTMLWLGPLLWVVTIALFGWFIYSGRDNYAKRVYLAGVAIIAVAIVGLLASPFVPPPVAASVQNIELRPVVENITRDFLAPFKTQMYYMLSATLLALLIFNQRFNILTAIRSLDTKLRTRPTKKKS